MEYYKIINDKDALIEFINWLPDLKDNEQYYLSLFARKKYCQDIIKSNDKTQLKRFTSTKERMFDKIKQLELQLGDWKLKDISVPQESLVVYIMPNPRCMHKATEMLGKKCWDLYRSKNYNLHAEAMSCIQKSKSRSIFLDFDIDTDKEKLLVSDISQTLNEIFPDYKVLGQPYTIIETRGGYHLLINIKVADNIRHHFSLSKNWYQEVRSKFDIDQISDQMIPIPGTIQGNFIPKMYY